MVFCVIMVCIGLSLRCNRTALICCPLTPYSRGIESPFVKNVRNSLRYVMPFIELLCDKKHRIVEVLMALVALKPLLYGAFI
jgi:hypothetical protein